MGREVLDLNAVEQAIAESQTNPNAGDVYYDTNSGNLTTRGGAETVKTTRMIKDGYAQ
jgi:hypothetical protein